MIKNLISQGTEYQKLKEQADFYEREAGRFYHNPIKRTIFMYLARQYDRKALHLTVAEASR